MSKFAKDQDDRNLDFNGQEGGVSYKQNKEYAYNASGKDARGNYGRGPTKGNAGDIAGPRTAAKIGAQQYRGVGGTEPKCPPDYDKINVGRGPTKGNSK